MASGGFNASGAVNLANNITTSNTALDLQSTVTLATGTTITLTSGTGALTIGGTTDGVAGTASTLVLNAEGGIINVAAIGSGASTQLTTVTLTNGAATNFNGAINITGALTQTNPATGTTTFASTVSVGSAVLTGTAYAVNNSLTSTGAIGVTNSGVFTKNATGNIVAAGGFNEHMLLTYPIISQRQIAHLVSVDH